MIRAAERRSLWLRSLAESGWEGMFAVAALLLVSRVLIGNLEPLLTDLYAIYWLLYLATGILMFWRFGVTWIVWAFRQIPLLGLVLGAALCSALWSLEPWLSFQGSVALLGNTLIGVFIGYAFPTKRVMGILLGAFIILTVVNLLAVGLPGQEGASYFGRGYLPVAWEGAMANKNRLGMVAALSFGLFLTGTVTGRIQPLAGVALILAALVTLVMAQAATSQIAVVLSAALLVTFALAKRFRFPALLVAIILLIVAAVATPFLAAQIDLVTGLVAREGTLTKRTAIWGDALQVIGASPLLGHGYRSVWGLGELTWFPQLAATGWAGHAHNAYLNLATDLGIPVALIACVYLLQTTWRGLQLHMWRPGSFALFTLIFFPMCLIINLAESWLFRADNLLWVVFVAVAVAAARLTSAIEVGDSRVPAARRGVIRRQIG